MEYSELVREIAARVSAYLENDCCDKKKLLILTHEHGTECHKVLECPKLAEHFSTECALLNEYSCDVDGCEGVVLFNLTNAALSRIVSGVCDTPYTATAAKALLLGKPVWVPKEEIEILKYDSATPYGQMMYEKLRQLERFGVTACTYNDLSDTIIGGTGCESACAKANSVTCCEEAPVQSTCKDFICSKKVITEKDMVSAHSEGAGRLLAGEKAIVTDLAREYARAHGIEIIKG